MAFGKWDLTNLYENNEKFLSDLEKVKTKLCELEKYRGEICKGNPETLLEYFKKDTEFSIILDRLAVYVCCKKDDDGRDQQNIKNYELVCNFFSEVGEKLAFAKTELSEIDLKVLEILADDPHFVDYNRDIVSIIRNKMHTLPEKEEKNIAKISTFSGTSDIFTMLSNVEMNHGTVTDENGKKIVLTPGNYNENMNSPSQKFRKKVSETYTGEYAKLSQTFSSLFTNHIKYQNYLAKTYNFESVLDMETYEEEVTSDVMLKNIQYVSSKVDLLKEYFKLKKKILNVDKFYTSDIGVEILGDEKVKISYEEATQGIANSFSVLGKDYQNTFLEAVSQGWIDAFPRDGKRSGGYTTSIYDCHPYILLNFDGTFEWASALAHEFGHAMHSVYSAKSQAYPKHDYTLFVAEIVSLTNEIIYNKYLLSKAKDKKTKMKLLSYFLQLFELNVFDSTMLADFELDVHDSLMAGEALCCDDYNKKYKSLAKKYFGKDVVFTKNFEYGWIRKGHLYRDYYLYKYSLGLCCACFVSSKILNDKNGEYLSKYKKFLSLGSSLDPISSLKVADIDVYDGKIYDFAFEMFENYLNELKKLTEEK